MALDSLVYLLETYWIFLALAFGIGIATGFYGTPDIPGKGGTE